MCLWKSTRIYEEHTKYTGGQKLGVDLFYAPASNDQLYTVS